MAELVHLRLEKKMRNEIKQAVNNSLYSSESDFIRNAIRKELETHQKIQVLKSLWGSVKEKKNNKPIPRSELFRAFGLE
jgi:Arc/MetJ-type ribon-helix-helix transcriptional regulator